jgi:NAD+ kinase
MADIKGALLFVNFHKPHASDLADEIANELKRLDMEVIFFPFKGCLDSILMENYSVAFSLGGDGTVLYAARTIAARGIPIFPINLGTLGFIAAVHPDEWLRVFHQWVQGDINISRRLMLEITVERRGKTIAQASCLNDAVISASGIAKIICLHVLDTQTPLGNYRSDGLIVATPTGSTAYSVAAGGPILDPEIEAVIINPICPFTLSNRPIVVPAQETIIVEVKKEQRSDVLLTLDGQVTEHLEPEDRVCIRQAPYKAQLIASDRRVFYNALRTKLNWSGDFPGSGVSDA